jgi:hypothetical protein
MVQDKRAEEKKGGRGQWAEADQRGSTGATRWGIKGAETEREMTEGRMLGSWWGGIEARDWPI